MSKRYTSWWIRILKIPAHFYGRIEIYETKGGTFPRLTKKVRSTPRRIFFRAKLKNYRTLLRMYMKNKCDLMGTYMKNR
jgi:hypothetical protein